MMSFEGRRLVWVFIPLCSCAFSFASFRQDKLGVDYCFSLEMEVLCFLAVSSIM